MQSTAPDQSKIAEGSKKGDPGAVASEFDPEGAQGPPGGSIRRSTVSESVHFRVLP